MEVLEKKVKPFILDTLSKNPEASGWVFQQAGDPAHRANMTQKDLAKSFGESHFWPKSYWPPNSLDANPLDYSVWVQVQSKACRKRLMSDIALKHAFTKVWNDMCPDYVRSACKAFRSQLEMIIERRGDSSND